MGEQAESAVGQLIAALADPTRRAVFEAVAAQPAAAGAIVIEAEVSRSAISQHLKVLRESGLVRERRVGRRRIYEAVPEGLDVLGMFVARWRKPEEGSIGVSDDDVPRDTASATIEGWTRGDIDDMARSFAREWPGFDPQIDAIMLRIMRISRHFEQGLREISVSMGLRGSDLLVLDALRRMGRPYEATPSQLKRIFLITFAGLTKCLARLEEAGYIQRRLDSSDRRRTVVSLSRKGHAALSDLLYKGQYTRGYAALVTMGQHDRDQLSRLLQPILRHIENAADGVSRNGQRRNERPS